jgi:hypothetical protein
LNSQLQKGVVEIHTKNCENHTKWRKTHNIKNQPYPDEIDEKMCG